VNDRAKAHGRSADAVLRWLDGLPVGNISLKRQIDHGGNPLPRKRDEIEAEIRLRFAGPVGEMRHVGGAPAKHLAANLPEVQDALRLARTLPGDDPIDHLERCLDDLCACLHSPKVRRAVNHLVASLLSAPNGEMSGDKVRRVISRSFATPLQPGEVGEAYPRTVWIRPAKVS
jgi:hypothetical protein